VAEELYINRYDTVCAQLLFNICKDTGVKLDNRHGYDRVPKSVETSPEGKVTILRNQQVQTERTIPINKPDVIIRDSEKGTCILLDIGISGDRNMIIKKEDEKIIKYKYLTTEVRRMWHVKTEVIPGTRWATRTISKPLKTIPEQHIGKVRN